VCVTGGKQNGKQYPMRQVWIGISTEELMVEVAMMDRIEGHTGEVSAPVRLPLYLITIQDVSKLSI